MKTILIADDEKSLRVLVRATLDDPDYTILEAIDGEETLTIARDKNPDLILLDWMMPGKSGIEVLKILKKDPALADIPVIMLTAKAQASEKEQGLAAGALAYLTKPFSPLTLLDMVNEFTGKGQAPT